MRVIEGRAKKVEGTPGHPVNQGKLCARGQALVQEQYHPDRIQGPLLRTGPRGSGAYLPISWDDALERLATRLRELGEAGRGDAVALLTRPLAAHPGLLVRRFAEATGARRLVLDPLSQAPLHEAIRRVFGTDRLPAFDLQNARFILSFGADFLSTWLSPVQYGVGYGIFRQGQYDAAGFAPRAGTDRPRGYFVQVEPRFSTTAASADRWLPIRPGTEGLLARALAQVIVAEGLAPFPGSSEGEAVAAFGGPGALAEYRPDLVAAEVGIAAERIAELAREFAARQPGLAIGGGPAGAQVNGTEILSDVYALNLLVGNVGRPGGVLLNPPPPSTASRDATRRARLADWQALVADLQAGRTDTVLLYDADPVHGLPAGLGLREALLGAPFIASFSSFLDDTTALADLILPSHLPLEDWGADRAEPGPRPRCPDGPAAGRRAAVRHPEPRGHLALPRCTTRGRAALVVLPRPRPRGGPRAAPPAGRLRRRRGVRAVLDGAAPARRLVGRTPTGPHPPAPSARKRERGSNELSPPSPVPERRGRGVRSDPAYPFHLILFPHNTLGDGRRRPPALAPGRPRPADLGDLAKLGRAEPAHRRRPGRPGGRPRRRRDAGRPRRGAGLRQPGRAAGRARHPARAGAHGVRAVGAGRGANPLDLLAPLVDEATGALAYAATRARLVPLGRRARLPKLEGTVPAYQIPDAEVLKVTGES